MSKLLNQSKGITLFELLVIIVVLGIISAIAILGIGSLIEKTRLNADMATIESLNIATKLYLSLNEGHDAFNDESNNSEELLQLLLTLGYLDKEPIVQTKDASFEWRYLEYSWTLSTINDDSINYVEVSEEEITRGSSWMSNWIINYIGSDTHLIIPESLGIRVIAVTGDYQTSGNTAFMGKNIQSVILPIGIEEIGSMAFRDNLLTSIVIPSSVTHIRSAAFRENPITEITIGNNVQIDDRVFGIGFNGATSTTNAFRTAYELEGAGTYKLIDNEWVKQ
jgi:type II secretory pathway pseudopilin PulG